MKIASALTLSIAVVGAALLMPASPANSQSQVDNAIPADMATRFTGKAGTVCGKVGKARYAENTEGTPTFLYMAAASRATPSPRASRATPAPSSSRRRKNWKARTCA